VADLGDFAEGVVEGVAEGAAVLGVFVDPAGEEQFADPAALLGLRCLGDLVGVGGVSK